MTRRYSMAYITAHGADPVAAVEMAARAGYDAISFRLLPAAPGDRPPPLMEDRRLVAEVMAALRDTGLRFLDAELVRLRPETDLATLVPFLDRAAEMGAAHVLVAGDDRERARLVARYGRLCEMADGVGLSADLEFMPWTGVPDLAAALEVIRAVGHPRAAVLPDALHLDRCGATLAEVAAIPPDRLNYVQLCDGPAGYDRSDAGMIRLAREARLVPGDGAIDLAALVARLPAGLTVSVEVTNRAQAAAEGREAFARRALEAARRVVAAAEENPLEG